MPLSERAALRKDAASASGVKLQHRHFALIADTLRVAIHSAKEEEREGAEWVAEVFAQNLRKTNPNFDRSRFLRACGIEG